MYVGDKGTGSRDTESEDKGTSLMITLCTSEYVRTYVRTSDKVKILAVEKL